MKQDSLGFLLADVSRLMRRHFQQKMEDATLTWAQARALVYISRSEGVRQIDLAEMLEVQPITLARLIDQLAEYGLVERRADPNDRRAYQIYLKEEAQPHLESIKQVAISLREQAMQGLTEQQEQTVNEALKIIRDNLGSN
jgi:DNA-binding MarR family transcriptional regulator